VTAAAPAVALAALVAGIIVGEARGPDDARAVVIALVIAVVVALAAGRSRAGWLRAAAALVACGLLGAGCMQRALHGMEVSPLRAAVASRADVVAIVTLLDDPDAVRWSASALVRVRSWAPDGGAARSAGGRRVLADATADSATRLALLQAGEGATVRGWLAPLDGYAVRAKWKHAVATLHVTDVIAVDGASAPLARVANRARELVLAGSDPLTPVDRAIVAGFLLGDTRAVPDAVAAQFRAAGLTHLMAVSGGNVAFVLALVAPILRRLRLGGRVVGSIAVMVVFGTMTRWEPSVARAVAMAAIGLVAGYLGRPTIGVRALLLAATGCSSSIPSSCTPWGSCCRARRASASRCGRGRSRPGSRAPGGCGRCSRSPPRPRSASRR
jgi:competence protein ComEC